jgi:hypothetical protein
MLWTLNNRLQLSVKKLQKQAELRRYGKYGCSTIFLRYLGPSRPFPTLTTCPGYDDDVLNFAKVGTPNPGSSEKNELVLELIRARTSSWYF